ncbi:AraC family transcriptional regulator [Hahella sp. CCB-MM4]|uniref:AraC family transcriptional regulator n=1 Tax=Hahella sp. (strain CCB-MM4) TaxID=1926491 RepID=UPI000B9BBCDE|nr:AraC family transcriptional regulator [Hahella sp. CCB-MM4]OZG72758.1 AraC family transcriptional regulator [Hahella sp. CCB-MM4]
MFDKIDELKQLISRNTTKEGATDTDVPRLSLIRLNAPSCKMFVVQEPSIGIAAQGHKSVVLGDKTFEYNPSQFLAVSVDVPVIGQVLKATPEEPYLCLRLDINTKLLSSIITELNSDFPRNNEVGPGIKVAPITEELLDAAIRYVRLVEDPEAIPVLAPLVEKEILYRMLKSDQASLLWHIAQGESRMRQVNRAIDWLKKNFDKPFSIMELASVAGMSSSSLHQHFKAITNMSPLNYQKQLRLQHARQLIFTESMDAATAGHAVGYESPSQFSREYKRLFGAPPKQDIANLLAQPTFADASSSV